MRSALLQCDKDAFALGNPVLALALRNGVEFVVSFLATTWASCASAPLNSTYKTSEADFYLEDCKASAVIVPRGTLESLRQHELALSRGNAEEARTIAVAQQSLGLPVGVVRAAVTRKVPVWEAYWNAESNSVRVSTLDASPLSSAPSRAVTAAGPSLAPLPTPPAKATALIIHTSGTTSRPKAVPCRQDSLAISARNIAETYALAPSDVTLLVMPLFHVHGLVAGLLAPLYAGGTVVIQPGGFSASSFWSLLLRFGATWTTAVPTMYQILLAKLAGAGVSFDAATSTRAATSTTASGAPGGAQLTAVSSKPAGTRFLSDLRRRSRLRFARSCSAALAPATHGQLEALLGVPVVEAYAMSEASHQMTSNDLPWRAASSAEGKAAGRKAGSVGRAQGTVIMQVRRPDGTLAAAGEVGEVCVGGPTVTSGYINNPEANRDSFTHDGMLRTGDQGMLDSDGYLFLTGRLKELINRGGEKIMPGEIDSVLLQHAGVSEAVAFGAPDPMLGQVVHAAVVPKPGAVEGGGEAGKAKFAKALAEFVSTRLAKFKVPHVIHIAEALPRTATGKIQRRFVAEHFLKKEQQQQPPVRAKL